jgi:16S rRNA C967 or C1407 C5-methylase (RsmB/RsmF family)
MIKLPFREYHLLELLYMYEEENLPMDLVIYSYFKKHKALGSKDRGFIAETAYALIRWVGLIDYLNHKQPTWENRYSTFLQMDTEALQQRIDIPLHTRVSFPQSLFDVIQNSFGEEQAAELCRISNTPAPTVVRANALKTTREALLEKWQPEYDVSATSQAPFGVMFHKKMNFFELPEFKAGLFEVQDEGSQLLADLVQVNPGQQVLDYCAGSGGKTLAFAPRMQQKGQIHVHDIRPRALQEARKRLKRAGIQNAQILLPDSPQLKKLKKKMNWVLVDAPCSGTGTLRRNPDMKWRFDEQMIPRLMGQQRTIFEKALSFLHPEGRIVYATCSLLKEENQVQMDHFIQTYNLSIEGEVFQSLPTVGGMDGFFGVVLKRA